MVAGQRAGTGRSRRPGRRCDLPRRALGDRAARRHARTVPACASALSGRPAYGYEISAWLRDLGLSDIAEGTIYALLVRIEQRGLVDVEKVPSEKGPPRKVYSLNAQGQAYPEEFWKSWIFLSEAVRSERPRVMPGRLLLAACQRRRQGGDGLISARPAMVDAMDGSAMTPWGLRTGPRRDGLARSNTVDRAL
ncbi:PadR family transcriptional regulator [Thermocatellispora tengchongensis]|uniref:PadR family transcriptional regulator n=1 Tax=Thermocatellispora tengchongensis TaxID=1073253 RepID=UPI00362DF054